MPVMSINHTVIFSRDPIIMFPSFFQDFHIMNSVLFSGTAKKIMDEFSIDQWNSEEDTIMDHWGHILACVLQLHYV